MSESVFSQWADGVPLEALFFSYCMHMWVGVYLVYFFAGVSGLTRIAMPGVWQPIHENHAIDVMAAVVAFAQPLPDRLLKRVLQVSEGVAFEAGLKSRHSIQQMGVVLTGSPPIPVPDKARTRGQVFNAQADSEEGPPLPGQLAEQLQVDQTSIVYRTWRYVSWKWQSQRMRELMMPALTLAQEAVAFGNQRLEYLDRFRFDGEPSAIEFSSLLQEHSGLVTAHGFRRSDLWHSYTGYFESPTDSTSTKRLFQINIDIIDEAPNPDVPLTRWANILTAREDRLNLEGADGLRDVAMVDESFDVMHTELKDLFGKIVTDAVAERVYLRG